MTSYLVTVLGDGTSIGLNITTCTPQLSKCYYIQPIPGLASNYTTLVTSINGDGTSGVQSNNTLISE